MKRVGKEPRLLPNVMEAIASLKEKHGSTQKQILEHISHILKKNKDNPRNVSMQVRRALEHGLHSGLIKQRAGKYMLGLDKRDYAIFRRFTEINDPNADCNSCKRGRRGRRRGKRGRRRRSRRRGRRGRRRAYSGGDDYTDDSESGRSTTLGTPEPMDRSRRRRRRRGRRRGKRRGRGRRRSAAREAHSDTSASVEHNKESSSNVAPQKKKSEQEKLDYQNNSGGSSNHNHQDRNYQEKNQSSAREDDDDIAECGNPECLCNVKQEDDSPRCMSRENNYYNSYFN